MKKVATLILLTFFAGLGILWWVQFALPRYQYIDLAVRAPQAVSIASDFLKSRHVDVGSYKTAVIFETDDTTDRYLQRTVGILASQQLLRRLEYDLFGWSVRFFKEKQKEEFLIFVSSKTGKVIGFHHEIDETAVRPEQDKESAKADAIAFLKDQFGFDPARFTLHSDNTKKQLHRTDYKFSWESKEMSIPWKEEYGGGSAKLVTLITVSGHDILSYTQQYFDIPEGFNRYVDNLKQTGENLTLVFRLFYLFLLTVAIMLVVNRKNHFVPRMVKSFYVKLGILLYALLVIEVLNSYQYLLYEYPTTQAFGDYMVRRFIENMVNPFFIVLAFILPGLAGESLRYEIDIHQKNRGFLSSIMSSFLTSATVSSIVIGYALCAFILGVQAFIYDFGYRYCGVWEELSWLTRASSSAFPAVTAMLIGLQASFSEETMFRLFGINLFKRFGFGAFAVVVSACMWGVGHTAYPIFPMWFRGLEVTCLGFIFGFAYLRFGLIAVIVAHYLMDAFLTSMPYLLVPKFGLEFYTSLFVIALPIFIAIIAKVMNQSTHERQWHQQFNAQQHFNCALLRELVQNKTSSECQTLKADLIKYGWDPAVVEKVFPSKPKEA